MNNLTTFRTIQHERTPVMLVDLYGNNLEPFYKPYIEFYEDTSFSKLLKKGIWDNSEYLLSLFNKIEKQKYSSKKVKDLKKFCNKNNLDFKEVFDDLLEIYEVSKKLKFWKI